MKLSLLGVNDILESDEVVVVVRPSMCLPGFPESVASSDMDGDGFRDLVVLDRCGEVTVRLGDSQRPWPGSFDTVHARFDLGIPNTFGSAFAEDFDADGRADVIVVDSGPGSAKKVWGFRQLPGENGERLGVFGLVFELDPLEPEERDDFRVVLGQASLVDLTGDDRPDLVVVVESPPRARLAIFYQTRSGSFPSLPSSTIRVTEDLGGRISVEGSDLTGDSRPELLIGIPGGIESSSELRIVRTR